MGASSPSRWPEGLHLEGCDWVVHHHTAQGLHRPPPNIKDGQELLNILSRNECLLLLCVDLCCGFPPVNGNIGYLLSQSVRSSVIPRRDSSESRLLPGSCPSLSGSRLMSQSCLNFPNYKWRQQNHPAYLFWPWWHTEKTSDTHERLQDLLQTDWNLFKVFTWY